MLVNGSLAVGILASLWFRITCFSVVGITNSRFFSQPNCKFGRTGSDQRASGNSAELFFPLLVSLKSCIAKLERIPKKYPSQKQL